jgi:hypothetical protein
LSLGNLADQFLYSKVANPEPSKVGNLGNLPDQFLTSKVANPIASKVGNLGNLARHSRRKPVTAGVSDGDPQQTGPGRHGR